MTDYPDGYYRDLIAKRVIREAGMAIVAVQNCDLINLTDEDAEQLRAALKTLDRVAA